MGCISEMMDSVNLRDDFYNPHTGCYYKIGKKLGKGGFSEVFSHFNILELNPEVGKKKTPRRLR